jgi:hypothetical protein
MRAAAILLMIGLGFSSLAQETETILYNMATSGLNLRSQPKSQSRVVTKIPYGTKMKIQEKTGITGKSGWIEDEWLKVEFRGRTGYVFAGYLSEMKAPEKMKTSGSLTTALTEFSERAFVIERQAVETIEANNLHCYQPFKGQVELETETENGLTSATLTFPSTDIFDAYVLLEALLYWNDNLALLDALRFVKGKDGEISKINDSEGLIRIVLISPNQVQLSLSDQVERSAAN